MSAALCTVVGHWRFFEAIGGDAKRGGCPEDWMRCAKGQEGNDFWMGAYESGVVMTQFLVDWW